MNRPNVSEDSKDSKDSKDSLSFGKYEAQILEVENQIFLNEEKVMAAVERYNSLQQILLSLKPKLQKNKNLREENNLIWQRIESFNESNKLLIDQSKIERKLKKLSADGLKSLAASAYEKVLRKNKHFQYTQLIPTEMIKPELELKSKKSVEYSELFFIKPVSRLSNSVLLKYNEKNQKLEKELQPLKSRLFQVVRNSIQDSFRIHY